MPASTQKERHTFRYIRHAISWYVIHLSVKHHLASSARVYPERENVKRGKTLRLRFQRFRNGSLRHTIIASLVLLGRSRLPDSCNYVTACVYHDVRKLENLRDLLRNLHPTKYTGNATTKTRRSKEINFRK